MGFLDIFKRPEIKKAFNLERIGMDGIPEYPNYDRQSLMGWFERNEVVYACIRKKCEAVVDPELIVEQQKGDEWEAIQGHPLVALLQKPNPDDTYDTFMAAWVASEECTGEFFAEIVRDKSGVPIELYPLDPWKMFPVYKGGKRAWWEFHSGVGTPVRLNLEDVLYRKKGVAPLRVAIGSVDADQAQTDFTRAFFHSDGIPAGILKVLNKTLTEEDANSLQQRWMTKFRRGGTNYKQVAVLDQNADYEQIGSNMTQVESAVTRGQIESRICMVFGVPPALIGAYVGMDLATNDATLKSLLADFWDNTMSPDLKARRAFLTWKLLPEFEPIENIKAGKIQVAYDMTYVMALQEDENSRHERARENFKASGISVNEFRESIGLDPIDGEDYFLQPQSVTAVAEQVRQILAFREPPEPPDPNEKPEGETVDGEIVEPKQIGDGKRKRPLVCPHSGDGKTRTHRGYCQECDPAIWQQYSERESFFEQCEKRFKDKTGLDATDAVNWSAYEKFIDSDIMPHLAKDPAFTEKVLGSNCVVKAYDHDGLMLRREPRDSEKAIDLKSISESYDNGKARINRVIIGIRNELIDQAVEAVQKLEAGQIYTLTLQPPPNAYKKLAKEITTVYQMGRQQVAKELDATESKDKQTQGWLARLIDLLISRIVNEVATRAINLFTSQGTLGLTDEEIVARLKDGLQEQSLKIFESYAAQTANAAINAGRDAEAEDRRDEWEVVEYSAILDANTCGECAAADGLTATSADELPEAPNPDCEGMANCRCFHIYRHQEGNA